MTLIHATEFSEFIEVPFLLGKTPISLKIEFFEAPKVGIIGIFVLPKYES